MYFKVYNPTPDDFRLKVQDTYVVLPPKEIVVVGEEVKKVAKQFATLEVAKATEKEYKDYRKAKEDKEKEAKAKAEALKAIKDKEEKAEAKILEAKAEKAEENKAKAEAKKVKHLEKVIAEEIKSIEATAEAVDVDLKEIEETYTVPEKPKVVKAPAKEAKPSKKVKK